MRARGFCGDDGPQRRGRRAITARGAHIGLAIIGLGTGVAALDTSVNVAFPAISAALALPPASIQWIVITYMLPFGALMLVCGRLGDSVGHRVVFRAGLALSALAFVASTFAPSLAVLLSARVLQGAGAAATLACAPALATFQFPEAARLRALALFGAGFAVAAAIGPVVGGPLVEMFGWRGVFGFRLPLVVAAFVLAGRLATRPAIHRPFHAPAAASLTAGVAALLSGLTLLQWPQTRLAALVLLAVSLAGLVLFSRLQRGAEDPFVPLAALSQAHLTAANAMNIAVNAAAFCVLLLVPYYLAARGLAPIPAGAVLASSSTGVFLGSLLAGRYGPLLGSGAMVTTGLGLCTFGLASIAFWSLTTPLALTVLALLLQGIGVGLFTVAYMDVVTGALAVKDRGVAGSIATATRTVGIVAGAGLFSTVFRLRLDSGRDFVAAFATSFLVAAIGLAAAAAAFLLWRMRADKTRPLLR